jgi:hypothetical protein
MVELPRACVRADEIAKHADFFSFGQRLSSRRAAGFPQCAQGDTPMVAISDSWTIRR